MRNYLMRMEREGIQKVKMFLVITAAYIVFWGPLFFVTIVRPAFLTGDEIYEVRTKNVQYRFSPELKKPKARQQLGSH